MLELALLVGGVFVLLDRLDDAGGVLGRNDEDPRVLQTHTQ